MKIYYLIGLWEGLAGSPYSLFLALGVFTIVGFLAGRFSLKRFKQESPQQQGTQDLRRAINVGEYLQQITETVRGQINSHRVCLERFQVQVKQLEGKPRGEAWQELCHKAAEVLKPTLDLATQIAHAYDGIRQQTNHLMMFTDARTDSLTGIGNRRALDEILANHLALHKRYGSSFSLAIFDVDFFKKVNDEDGHLQGDRILQDMAQTLDGEVRQTDFVGRYGGEEFVVIMPGTSLENAAGFADRLREIVEERLPITTSGGVAASLPGDSSELIIARADLALYEAKNMGRNRVCLHDGESIEMITPESITPESMSTESMSTESMLTETETDAVGQD